MAGTAVKRAAEEQVDEELMKSGLIGRSGISRRRSKKVD